MISSGTTLQFESGRVFRVDDLISAGAQGEAYWALETSTGQRGVMKKYHASFVNDDSLGRLRYLVQQDLHAVCPVLCAPIDLYAGGDILAHFAPMADGRLLDDYLENPEGDLVDRLQMAIALSRAVAALHGLGIAHGDLHAGNLIVHHAGSVLRLHLIDFDNFDAPGLPPPPCVGHNLYMAPELRLALARGAPAIPGQETDRFSLGVLLHEILLLRHLCSGHDQTEAEFQQAMCGGRWLQDPVTCNGNVASPGGYSPSVLNVALTGLFRDVVSLDPAARPCAVQWESELVTALSNVYLCDNCAFPSLIDVSKVMCPSCRHPFPRLSIRCGGRTVALQDGATVVGRSELGGSEKISARHAIFRRIGPDTRMESVGRNGSFRWNGSGWIKLPDRTRLLVQKGDRLRFADVEVQVV